MITNEEILRHELEGAIELKLDAQVVHVAERLLTSPKLTSEQFEAALGALQDVARITRRRRKMVEQAFAALDIEAQHDSAALLFDFYITLPSMKKADEVYEKFGPFNKPCIIDVVCEWMDEQRLKENLDDEALSRVMKSIIQRTLGGGNKGSDSIN